jgi:putative modified peptide
MSQQGVERTIGKLCTDEEFRSRFFSNPAAAVHEAGLPLSPAELEALAVLSVKAVVRFGRTIDPRIRRLSPWEGLAEHRFGSDGR